MEKNIASLDLNTESFNEEVPLENRLEKVIAAWESDSESFDEIDSEIDLEDAMFTVLNELEDKNLWNEIEKLDRALQCQLNLYEDYSKYISQSLIPLYLAEDRENSKEQKSRIENCLKPFYKCPDESYEVMADVLNKLICYDRSSIAVDLCKKTYTQIANSKHFFSSPKSDIAEIIVWDEFQEAYIKLKENMDVDWLSYDERFKTYEYQFTQDNFKKIEEVMKGRLDLAQIFDTFKKKEKMLWALFQIKLAFCCQIYDLDGTSFVTSNNFATKIINSLATIPGRERCPLQTFFKIKADADFFMLYVKNLSGEWFDSTTKMFAFLGALPLFYQFLFKAGIIKKEILEELLLIADISMNEYVKLNLDKPWKLNFTKKFKEQSIMLAQSEIIV